MADIKKGSLFAQLTRLFRSGPSVRRKVKNFDPKSASSTLEIFKKAHSNVYNSTLTAYGAFDRMSRYSDFSEMEATPELCSALDIFAEETAPCDDRGKVLHIQSDNTKIQELLEELFYDVLNVDFNLVMWTRNLVKYGDFFLFNDISPEYGIINVYPIPISEIEREEGFDKDDPSAVRFRWITQGNKSLENWQVSHFRLLGNDAFLPYGSSVLESARRIWRQLILMEDAMLVYRVIRAPERRVFYIDVGNVPPDQVANYMEQSQTSLKRQPVIDRNTGKMDLRFNPYTQEEDYFLPVRGGESGTRIDTLAGGVNAAAIEDVEYIQKKLFAALKIPKAYLGYDEDIGSKATLAQEDIRFSRTIQHIQKTVISELEKIAMIHLYCHGFDPEDISDFTIRLTNPSSVAQLQKLELIKTKFEIASSTPEGVVDRNYIRKNVIGLTDDEIEQIKKGRIDDKIEDAMVEKADDELDQGASIEDSSITDMGDEPEPATSPEAELGDTGSEENIFAGDRPKGELLTAKRSDKENHNDDDYDEEYDEPLDLSMDDDDAPEKAEKKLNIWGGPIKANRKITNGRAATHMPDFFKMTSIGSSARNQDSMNKPYGDIDESVTGGYERKRVSNSLEKLFQNMSNSISINRGKNLLSEQKLDETYEDDNDEA